MESAAAVESSPEPAAAMESAANRRAMKASTRIAAVEPTSITRMYAVAAVIPAVPVAAAVPIVAITITAPEPRTRPDKQPANEVIRPVIPIWRTRIRIVAVVPIRASRRPIRRIPITADADADSNLRMRGRRGHRKRQSEDAKKCKIP